MGEAVVQFDHTDILWPHTGFFVYGASGTFGHIGPDETGHGLGFEGFDRIGHQRLGQDGHVGAQAMLFRKSR
ncbi:hypothetical protein D3C87_1974120 [compost metagenome]